LDKKIIGGYVAEVWKKELNTGKDPANGRWYENGAQAGHLGLYGGLTDNASTELIFDEAQKNYYPECVVCDTATLDNRNGLAPQSTVELHHSYSNSTTTTHSTTNSLKVGVAEEIKAKVTLFGIGAESTTKFSFEYTHSWSDSTSVNESNTYTFKQGVTINTPAGKVYKAVLTARSQQLSVPYRAMIYVTGITETWFEDRVAGHYNWQMSAGDAFEKIARWGLAGSESHCYGRDPKDPCAGTIAQNGRVTARQTSDFVAKIYDITDTYEDETEQGMLKTCSVHAHPLMARLVMEIPFDFPASTEMAPAA
jgi:hypothetical protein